MGRELDTMVAEKVLGLKMSKCAYSSRPLCFYKGYWRVCGEEPVNFSRNIAAAWEVVEKMGGIMAMERDDRGVWVSFNKTINGKPKEARASAKSAPLAICLAALKAIQV